MTELIITIASELVILIIVLKGRGFTLKSVARVSEKLLDKFNKDNKEIKTKAIEAKAITEKFMHWYLLNEKSNIQRRLEITKDQEDRLKDLKTLEEIKILLAELV